MQPVTSRTGLDRVLYEAEKALTDPQTRRSRARIEALLHPLFSETGSSGEVYDRERMIKMMLTQAPGEVVIREFKAQAMSEDIALVTYRTVGSEGQEARRTSVWARTGSRWQLRHHHGTRITVRSNRRR